MCQFFPTSVCGVGISFLLFPDHCPLLHIITLQTLSFVAIKDSKILTFDLLGYHSVKTCCITVWLKICLEIDLGIQCFDPRTFFYFWEHLPDKMLFLILVIVGNK